MALRSRRSFLAAVTTAAVGSVAGCADTLASLQSPDPPPEPLDGHSIHLADGVGAPDLGDVTLVDDPAAADLAVFPDDAGTDPLATTLAADTAVVAVGEDAQPTVMAACRADGRPHGFARDSWGPDTRVVAATPSTDALDTHLLVGVDLPDELAWALGEVHAPPERTCTVPFDHRVVPPSVEGSTTALGTARVRGRNDVATFDRRDRVRVASDGDAPAIVVDVAGTIEAGSDAVGDPAYDAETVRLVAEFDAPLGASGPPARSTGPIEVQDRTDPTEDAVDRTFTATADATRRSFTACQRAFLTPEALPDPVSYTANARFAWRAPRLLREDDRLHHHTPGRAVWHV